LFDADLEERLSILADALEDAGPNRRWQSGAWELPIARTAANPTSGG
jgi:hypothetical protein